MWFTSDNAVGAAPEVMAALAAVNEGPSWAYGADENTTRAADMLRERFDAPDAAVYFVATGTAANSLSLACLCPPWGTVLCHPTAHVELDECGAPEFFTGGAKLVHVDGVDARMTPDALKRRVTAFDPDDIHMVQKGALSLTQTTEAGTVYPAGDLAALAGIAKAAGIPVHLDGTRLGNALAATNASPAEMTWKAGVDIACVGATKGGALAAEAVVIFNDKLAREFEFRRKRGGHLFSKMRFLAAQFEAMLTDDLWLRLARHANAMAKRLSEGVSAVEGVSPLHPTEANLVFLRLPAELHEAALARGVVYRAVANPPGVEEDGRVSARLVCSFRTTEEEVDAAIAAFKAG